MRLLDSHFAKAVGQAIKMELKGCKPLCLEMKWKGLYWTEMGQ